MDIVLVTHSGLPELVEDERILAEVLAGRGLTVGPAVWDDPAVEWAGIGLCVIRSTWDYHHRLDEFLAWVKYVDPLTDLWNPARVVRWNSRKTYLNDLSERGVPIVPTQWLTRRSSVSLLELMAEQDWNSAVVKPVVSASAFGTMLVTEANIAVAQRHFDTLLAERDMMMQPFLQSVETYGEHSLMFVDGRFTHCVRRVAVVGSNTNSSEAATLVGATQDSINFAEHVLEASGFGTLYARVDIVRDSAGALCLMELELIEPSLFLKESPEVAERLADAISERILLRHLA